MSRRATRFKSIAALAGLIALGACGRGDDNNLAAIDNELIANGSDPALTSALEDQIMVDPNLIQQANPNSVRPPDTPVQAQYPADAPRAGPGASGGAHGGRMSQASAANTGGPAPPPSVASCGGAFDYGPQWAGRMPADFPAYPGGRLTEAAGNNHGDCRMRVVTFTTPDPSGRVLRYYQAVAGRAGFSAEQQQRGGDLVLGGTKGDAAYYLIVTPVQAGSEVALIVNNGR